MSLRELPEGGWAVQVRARTPAGVTVHVRRQSTRWNRREAERFERSTRYSIEQGQYRDDRDALQERTGCPTLAEYAPTFEDWSKTHNKPSEQRTKSGIIRNHLVPAFGHMELHEIDREAIDWWKAEQAGVAPRTLNNRLSVLRKLLGLALDDGYIDVIPPLRFVSVPKQDFDFLDLGETTRFLAAADPEWRCLFTLAVRTGLRRGELFGLRWKDVDLETGRIHVAQAIVDGETISPKSASGYRWVPLTGDAREALRAHWHMRGELVFCRPDGTQITPGLVKWPLKRACARAQLGREIGLHDLRHSFASHLAMLGRSLLEIKELLGHSTLEMTLRYAHLAPDQHREAIAALDQAAQKRINIGSTSEKPTLKIVPSSGNH